MAMTLIRLTSSLLHTKVAICVQAAMFGLAAAVAAEVANARAPNLRLIMSLVACGAMALTVLLSLGRYLKLRRLKRGIEAARIEMAAEFAERRARKEARKDRQDQQAKGEGTGFIHRLLM